MIHDHCSHISQLVLVSSTECHVESMIPNLEGCRAVLRPIKGHPREAELGHAGTDDSDTEVAYELVSTRARCERTLGGVAAATG